jgi:hypothetical protein
MPLRRRPRTRRSVSSSKRERRGSKKSEPEEEEVESEEVTKTESEDGSEEETTGEASSPSRSKAIDLDSNEMQCEEDEPEPVLKKPTGSKLGKRQLPLLSFSLSTAKRPRVVSTVSLQAQCQDSIPSGVLSDEELSSDSEEEFPRADEKGFTEAVLEVEIAEWVERSLNDSLRLAKEKVRPDQSKAHLSVDERIEYELANGRRPWRST